MHDLKYDPLWLLLLRSGEDQVITLKGNMNYSAFPQSLFNMCFLKIGWSNYFYTWGLIWDIYNYMIYIYLLIYLWLHGIFIIILKKCYASLKSILLCNNETVNRRVEISNYFEAMTCCWMTHALARHVASSLDLIQLSFPLFNNRPHWSRD